MSRIETGVLREVDSSADVTDDDAVDMSRDSVSRLSPLAENLVMKIVDLAADGPRETRLMVNLVERGVAVSDIEKALAELYQAGLLASDNARTVYFATPAAKRFCANFRAATGALRDYSLRKY